MAIEIAGEEYWNGLLDREVEQMNESRSRMFMVATMMEQSGEEKIKKAEEGIKEHSILLTMH